jgi:general secretion pathway protein K
LSPLSLLTFFAAAKKVSAAPHRGNANKPIRMQGKANAAGKQQTKPKQSRAKQTNQRTAKKKSAITPFMETTK